MSVHQRDEVLAELAERRQINKASTGKRGRKWYETAVGRATPPRKNVPTAESFLHGVTGWTFARCGGIIRSWVDDGTLEIHSTGGRSEVHVSERGLAELRSRSTLPPTDTEDSEDE